MRIPLTLRLGSALLVAGCLVEPWSGFAAQGTGGEPKYSTSVNDRLACERQLNIIYGALSEYRRDHDGQYPETLQALSPAYLHDDKFLICPYVQKRGGLKVWKKTTKELSSDFYTSYGYELGNRLLEDFYWRGVPRKTFREYKLKLIQKLPQAPVVRCHDHRPYLNLAVDGEIYECDHLDWEKKYNLDESATAVQQFFALPTPPPLSATQFAPRDPRLKSTALDLTPYYNGLLASSWQGCPGNDLANLKPGFYKIDGTQFDIRGVIQLKGLEVPVQFPARIDGIKLGMKCTRLHFIHAAGMFIRGGATNGFYVFHYSDGQALEFPLIYGRDTADWWPDPYGIVPTDATVAWTGENQATRVYGRSIQLFHRTFVNTRPEIEISAISFDSRGKNHPSGPFIVAITLDQK